MSKRIVILCPLEIERRWAARRVGATCEVRRIGPGASNVARAMETISQQAYELVVLFGVVGGLAPTDPSPVIGEVVDGESGQRWSSPIADGAGVTVVGVAEPVCSPPAKGDLRAQWNASLVDCESHEFARRCEASGATWAIVRGVSDGPDEALPASSARWITCDGRTRLAGVAMSCVCNPLVIGSLLRLGWRTKRALVAAGDRLATLVTNETERVHQ